MDKAKRNTALDITRLYALLCVICVHFFLYNGFYDIPCDGWKMYLACCLRCSFMVCIPLFLLLTGYLMSGKTLTKKYFTGIDKTLGVYVLASIVCLLMKKYFFEMSYVSVFDIFNFTAATYGWYVEMYIGLFLMIPFLNLIYRGLNGKKQKLLLIGIFTALTLLPSVINIYDLRTPGAFADPSISQMYYHLIPRFWVTLYPVTYYFIGAFLREYPVRMKTPRKLALYAVSLLLFASFAFYRSGSGTFDSGTWQNWESLLLMPLGVSVFILLTGLETSGMPSGLRRFLAEAADVSFGAYLLSCVFDKLFYTYLDGKLSGFFARLPYFPVVFATFALSLLASFSVTTVYSLLRSTGDKLVGKRGKKTEQKEEINISAR